MAIDMSRVDIVTDIYIPGYRQIRFPKRLRHYKQRTLKRWHNNPANWTEGEIYMINGKLMCHPNMLARIEGLLKG